MVVYVGAAAEKFMSVSSRNTFNNAWHGSSMAALKTTLVECRGDRFVIREE